MKLFRSSVLFAPNDEPSGGGGGGETPKQLTEEDVGRIANQAITAQFKRLNIEGKIGEAIKGLDLDTKFKELVDTLKPQGEAPKGPGGTDAKSELPPEVAKHLQQLTDQLESEKAARLAEKTAREESERKHQFDTGRQRLYESLKTHADSNLHDVWVDHLIHHNRLKVEDGHTLLEVEHSPVKGMPKQKEFLPLEDALPHLIGSQDSKRFMAVPDPSGGAGSRAPRGKFAGGDLNSKTPADRVRARLQQHGIDADAEFGG